MKKTMFILLVGAGMAFTIKGMYEKAPPDQNLLKENPDFLLIQSSAPVEPLEFTIREIALDPVLLISGGGQTGNEISALENLVYKKSENIRYQATIKKSAWFVINAPRPPNNIFYENSGSQKDEKYGMNEIIAGRKYTEIGYSMSRRWC